MNKKIILEKLKEVKYPGFSKDIVTFGFVKDVKVDDKKVDISLEITSSANEVKDEIVENIKKVLSEFDVNINLNAPQEPKKATPASKNIVPSIKNFLMISSGKGGVGKTTTSVNIAIALAMQGKKVGLLDADIYGPNVPRMMGIADKKPVITEDNKLEPFECMGVSIMSMGSLVEESQSLIWRGSMIMKAITQLLQDVKWGELDVLVIDMPPGTGDAQLTLAQSVPVTCGVVVTTPQLVALDDSKRSLDMFDKLKIPIAGIVENMSGFVCPSCDSKSDIFSSSTTENIAKQFNTETLAKIPIEPAIREGGDNGKPIVYNAPESFSAKEYMKCSDNIWDKIQEINKNNSANNESIQPTNPKGVSACSSSNSGSGSSCGCD
jgi:ATP-binding protein involved in chromosome partitioning